MTNPTVVADGLTARAGGATLVHNLSFSVETQQLLAVAGPNGAGKSTLLEMLAGTRRPDSGSAQLLGTDVANLDPHRLAKLRAFLGQHVAGDIPFTVQTVVAMGRYAKRDLPDTTADDNDSAVTQAMRATDVSNLAERVVATLSKGEEQRVHVARVLAQDSPILLLDEPTSSLDIAHQQLVLASLRAVARAGGTVIVVLHDLNLAASFADRLVLLSRGELIASGPPREVLREDLISSVYGHEVHVVDHPFQNSPLILPATSARFGDLD